MRLSSARELKNEITADPRWRRARTEKNVRMAIGIALGEHPDAYRIAVRAEDPDLVDQEILERIKREAKGEVDVQYTGPLEIVPVHDPVPVKRLEIGASIAHYSYSAGTIGFFARRTTDDALGVVSNNHVLAGQDQGRNDDDVLHPAPADHGTSPNDVVAYLDGDYPRLRTPQQTVDCAFARLARDISCDPRKISATETLRDTIGVPEKYLQVEKIGRTTKRTSGRIVTVEIEFVDVRYRLGYVPLFNQMEIESISEARFCSSGDSGSLVFTRDCEPVGLLFLGTRAGGAFNAGRAFANPIGDVLRSLSVTFA
jgi:hypothetical protein